MPNLGGVYIDGRSIDPHPFPPFSCQQSDVADVSMFYVLLWFVNDIITGLVFMASFLLGKIYIGYLSVKVKVKLPPSPVGLVG